MQLVPYRTDYVFRAATRFTRRNPFLTAALYFVVSYGGLYLLGFLTGRLDGFGEIAPYLSSSDVGVIVDNISLAFLAPVGAGLLCVLYAKIEGAFSYIESERILDNESDRVEHAAFVEMVDRLYNSRAAAIIGLVAAASFSAYNYVGKTGTWLSIDGGLPGLWGRFFITINYYIVVTILYKCAVSVWALQKTLAHDIRVRPLHPDRCGGLQPIGSLSIAINNFLALVIFWCALLSFFDSYAQRQVIYAVAFALLYAAAPFLLFGSLAKAHKVMLREKNTALDRLSATFEKHYERLTRGPKERSLDVSSADEIVKVHSLYRIVTAMPVWPFDMRSLRRVGGTFLVPLLLFLIKQATSDTGFLRKLFGG